MRVRMLLLTEKVKDERVGRTVVYEGGAKE